MYLITLEKSRVIGKGLSTFTVLLGLLSSVTSCVSREGIAVVKTFPTFFTLIGLSCSVGHTVGKTQSGR